MSIFYGNVSTLASNQQLLRRMRWKHSIPTLWAYKNLEGRFESQWTVHSRCRPVARGERLEEVPLKMFLCPPSKFVVSRKICLKHLIKQNLASLIMYFPLTLKTSYGLVEMHKTSNDAAKPKLAKLRHLAQFVIISNKRNKKRCSFVASLWGSCLSGSIFILLRQFKLALICLSIIVSHYWKAGNYLQN